MNIDDLGPLERAALRAVLRAELVGAPLTVASIWRSLPRYTTSLPNVRAALEDGAPLRNWVARDKDHHVIVGREDLLRGMARRQGAADARWRELEKPLRGLSKLPWVEAVGITGTMALGLLDADDAPCPIVVIAEGGRVPLARAAVRAWRRAAGLKAAIRIAAVLDGDDLALPEGDETAAWWLLSVRPVTNEQAFERLFDANPWARAAFPNCDARSTGGVPEFFVGARIDGKLAALRRAAVARGDDGVLLTSAQRSAGWEEPLQDLVKSRPMAAPCREWGDDLLAAAGLEDGDARVAAREAELATWTFGEDDESEAPEAEAEEEPAAVDAPAAPTADAPKVTGTKSRAPKTRPRPQTRPKRSRSAAAPEG